MQRSDNLNTGEGLTPQRLHRLAPKPVTLFPCGHTVPASLHTNLHLHMAGIFWLLWQFGGIG